MKKLLILTFLAMSIGAMAQKTFKTDKAYTAIKHTVVSYSRVLARRKVVTLSATNDTVWLGRKMFVYVSPDMGYVHGKESVGIFYWTGLDGAYCISIEYDQVVYFYHHGDVGRLDGGWVFIKEL